MSKYRITKTTNYDGEFWYSIENKWFWFFWVTIRDGYKTLDAAVKERDALLNNPLSKTEVIE